MIKNELTLLTKTGLVPASEVVKFAEMLMAVFPKDLECYLVTVNDDGLTVVIEEEH